MKFCSFDVFDTSLVRSVIAPSEVFRRMGTLISNHISGPLKENFPEEFIDLRRRAESLALKKSKTEETTLDAIWHELRLLLPLDQIDMELSSQLELTAESHVLVPVASIQEEIVRQRAAGRRILFISDTYLPESFVQGCLERHGLMTSGDILYTSSRVGLTKRSGNLFRHVLEKEKIDPAQLLHVGDNWQSDVVRPRALGIECRPFLETQPTATERLILSETLPEPTAWLDQAGKMRIARLAQAPSADQLVQGVRVYVTDFLGPFLSVFAFWILQEARTKNISRLYFASRDARLLWSVCRQICRKMGIPIECHYLLISRQAIMLPSVTEVSREGIPWLEKDYERSLLPRLLGKLELSYDEFWPVWSKRYPGWKPEDVLSNDEQRAAFWQTLQEPPFRDKILANAAARRESALAYFEKIGLLEPKPTGLVDLGWFRTCQKALNEVCAARRGGVPIDGFYFGVVRGHHGFAEAGPASALFNQDAPDLPTEKQNVWVKNITLLEHLLGLCDQAGTRGYESGEPVHFDVKIGDYHKELFAETEKALLHYVGNFGPTWEPFAADRNRAADLAGKLIASFLKNPDPRCVEALRKLPYSQDQNHLDEAVLISPFTWQRLLQRVLAGKKAPKGGAMERLWPEASWLISSPSGRLARVVGQLLLKLRK